MVQAATPGSLFETFFSRRRRGIVQGLHEEEIPI
jgi:hypothetical protein